MGGLLLLLGIGAGLFLAALVGQVAWTLTHPPRKTYSWAVARGRPSDPSELDAPRRFESWTFGSRGRELPVWAIPGDAPAGPVVIVTHGWGDSRLGGLVRLDALVPHARRVILWDLPGHGEAPGRCAMGVGEVEDLLTLADRVDTAHERVVLYGWSLGAGVSIAAAARAEGIAGVIAEAPYRHAITPAWNVMALNHLPHRLNLPIAMGLLGLGLGAGARWRRGQDGLGFDRAAHAARVTCPLLVLHGTDDEICPFQDGRTIEHAADDAELAAIEGAMHNNLWTEPAFREACAEAVGAFLERVGGRARNGAATEAARRLSG